MKAWCKYNYGGPELLKFEETEKPTITDDQVLVKVMANSVNPADWHILRGTPILARFAFGLFKPRNKILGADFAGVVEALGANVTDIKIGDRVFGEMLEGGAFAEYLAAPEHILAAMPKAASFEEMASFPVAGLTALQGLVQHGKIKAGETVLINGASGGVGHFAVQIAKAFGAKVTGVCSSKNADFVKSLGADHVVPYDKENIHEHSKTYDLVVDTNGNLFHSDFTRMGCRGVLIGFTSMPHMIALLLTNVFSKFPFAQFTAEANRADLESLASLAQKEQIKAHISKSYPSAQIPEAISYIEAMRTQGKVAISWED
jgi:NADPH:quinone reductase-like Zn-dependent oxidoreductase